MNHVSISYSEKSKLTTTSETGVTETTGNKKF